MRKTIIIVLAVGIAAVGALLLGAAMGASAATTACYYNVLSWDAPNGNVSANFYASCSGFGCADPPGPPYCPGVNAGACIDWGDGSPLSCFGAPGWGGASTGDSHHYNRYGQVYLSLSCQFDTYDDSCGWSTESKSQGGYLFPEVCFATGWTNDACNAGECDGTDKMRQVATMNNAACTPQSRCVDDESCTSPPPLVNSAQFISQSVPKTTLAPGEAMNVSVTMRNCRSNNDCTNLKTWTPAANHRLGSQNPQDNMTWGLARVLLLSGTSVSPGSQYTFSFTITAPLTPGAYNFQWRMVQEAVEWFGDYTTNVSIAVAESTPPTGTITTIATPRNTRLTSSGQGSGTIAGTASDNVGVTSLALVIREWNGVGTEGACDGNNRDWNGTGWQGACSVWVTPTFTPGPSVTWTYSGGPTEALMTSGRQYHVYLLVSDAAGNNSAWNPNTLILFDNTPPTGTITGIPNPTNTRLTSTGSPNGTVAGTAQDDFTGVAATQMVIRRGDGSVCDDWNGSAWVSTCIITTPNPSLVGATWTFGSTPPLAQMTNGQTYRVWLNLMDGAGNWSNWSVYTPLILYQLPNQAPTASNVKAQEPDYCSVGPSVTISWVYSDPELTPQSAYQIQIDNNAGFSSPEFDSGKSAGAITSYYVGTGLTWGTVYRSRVRVWDAGDLVSAWTEQSLCAGPPGNPSGCQGDQKSWKSPNNQYPSQISTFSWTPSKVIMGKVTQFDDAQTTCYKTPPNTVDTCSSWNWTFGDGGTSTLRDPTHTFASYGTYNVTLKATDSLNGYACSATKTINVQKPIPAWKEIIPE